MYSSNYEYFVNRLNTDLWKLLFLPGEPIIEVGNQIGIEFKVKSLRSKNYFNQDAAAVYNIHCKLHPTIPSNTKRTMNVVAYEFAPFAESEDYCMYIDNALAPVQCSGSKKFQKSLGAYESSTGWEFRMVLKNSTEHIPTIRFWITITSK